MKLDSAGQLQTHSQAIVTASYVVSLRVTKTNKPHNIAETLMKPCLVECAGILLGEGEKSTVKQVSLSNVTVKSGIADMSCDVKSEFHRYFRGVEHDTPMMVLTRNLSEFLLKIFQMNKIKVKVFKKSFWI